MKKTLRVFTVILSVMILAVSSSGCLAKEVVKSIAKAAAQNVTEEETAKAKKTEKETPAETAEESHPKTAEKETAEDSASYGDDSGKEAEAPAAPSDFGGQVLIDNDDVTIMLKDIESDDYWGYTLNCELENKTDKELMYSVEYAAVNGWEVDPFFAASVDAGKKSLNDITFDKDSLEMCGIRDITKIVMTFRVYDYNDWMAEPLLEGAEVTIYPKGEWAHKEQKREPEPTDVVLVDNDKYTVTVVGEDTTGYLGYQLYIYLENKTDAELSFEAEKVSINGYMCDPYWIEIIRPGTRIISSMSWYDSDLENIGITRDSVETIEFTLSVMDMENWNVLTEEKFSLTR